jgi:hypothetical protein
MSVPLPDAGEQEQETTGRVKLFRPIRRQTTAGGWTCIEQLSLTCKYKPAIENAPG